VDEDLGISRITLNRPGKLNALDLEVLEELCHAFESLDRRDDVRVIILDSSGDKAFIAGADIEQMAGMRPLEFRHYTTFLRKLAQIMTSTEKAIIGAVRGMAFGGGNIVAMNCDFVFATPGATFGQQEIDLGIIGGIARLIYLVGARKAWDIVMTGRTVGALEAEQIGLITKCVPEEEFQEYVLNYAKSLVGKSDIASRLAKSLKKISEKVGLDTAYEYENELISLCFDSEDTRKRLNDFVIRRKQKRQG
jgi:enoyl-CoA hydratase